MRKLRFVNSGSAGLTFSEGCELYLMNCRQRNLREGTINHYRQSYTQFYKYFDPEMPVGKFNSAIYNKYVIYLCDTLHNDISVNSYLLDLITTLHFLMEEGSASIASASSREIPSSSMSMTLLISSISR